MSSQVVEIMISKLLCAFDLGQSPGPLDLVHCRKPPPRERGHN